MAKTKKYRCLNFGNCDKAGKKEQFEIPEGGEMKCPECGSEMIQEVKASNGMMIAIIVTAVIAIIVAAFAMFRGSEEATEAPAEEAVEEVVEAPATDSIDVAQAEADAIAAAEQAKADSIAAAEAEALALAEAKAKADSIAKAEADAKAKNAKPAAPSNYLTNARCEYGLYTGPAVNGKPGGGLGTIKVQGNHTIDLQNARKETINITNGDLILKAKYTDGRLVSGLVKFANGQAKQFNIGI